MGVRGNKEKFNAYQRDYRKKNPERMKDYELRRTRGITLDDYNALLRSQNNVCAICGRSAQSVGTGKNSNGTLAVDHCHDTGATRGLLCTNCNLGLGSFFDSPELLRKAAVYVEDHKTMVLRLLEELLVDDVSKA